MVTSALPPQTRAEGRGGGQILSDYYNNGGNILLMRKLLGTELYKKININGEELKERYMREAGRELTDANIDAAVKEAHKREKRKREL